MLRKIADVTIIPAVAGDPGQLHTHECTVVSPGGDAPPDAGGGSSDDPFIFCRSCVTAPGEFYTLCLPYPFPSCP